VPLAVEGELGDGQLGREASAVAAAAVDLVVSQIQRRERGLPDQPKTVLIEGTWVDGVTTRSQ
jgi:LacI family transcriptional regulator/LacI family fructose operon transcriptional repressor